MDGFTTELERARQAGVSPHENLPFMFEPKRRNGQAVLLIHGFCASPYEMRPIGELLCNCGYLVLGVRLEGHGSNPDDLRNRSWQEWLESVERGFSILEKAGLPISLIGQSTGALLGLSLSHRKKIERMILLSPFLKLRHPLSGIAGLLKHLIPFQHRQLPTPQSLHYYERRPLAGIEQVGLLRDEIVPLLSEIDVPTLVLSAAGDQTVAVETGNNLYEKLGSPHKEFHLFSSAVPHVLSTDENPQFDETCRFIEEFLAKTEQPQETDS